MSSLQQEAYNYIKDLILTNRLDVNNLYSETKLSKELGISRTPMREALQCLSQDGYIDVIPSKGFRIRQLNQKDIRLKRKIPKLSEQEWRMCCLIKMEVPPSTAAMLLCCTNQAISMRRVRLYQKITGEKGTPELCDSFIRDF